MEAAVFQAKRQVTIPTKIAYGAGIGISSVKDMLFHFFFLFYFSNLLGVPALWVGFASVIALVFDAISDPIMGQITDNYSSKKWGRRHFFLLISVVPTALAIILLFHPPSGLGQVGLFIWMTGFAIFVRLALTVYRVPYYSMGAELSSDYNERTNIVSIREIAAGLYNATVFVLGFLVFLKATPEYEDGMMNMDGYGPLSIAVASVGLVGAFISIYGTKHKIADLKKNEIRETKSWTKAFSELAFAWKIGSFRNLVTGYSLIVIKYGAASAMTFYIGVYFWQFSQGEKALVGLMSLFSVFPATFLASLLTPRIGKRALTMLFAATYMITSIIPYAMQFLGLMPPIGTPAVAWIVAAFQFMGVTGLIGMATMSFSMLADVSDEMALASSKRQEGILYSLFSFVQKMTFGVGTMLVSFCLWLVSFPVKMAPSNVEQSAIDSLGYIAIVIPILFGISGIYYLSRYRLDRKRLNEIQAELEQRKVEQTANS